MTKFVETELQVEHFFDRKSCRHYLNDELSVLHCHHYLTLYTQLAEDVEFIDGKKLLMDVSEDSFYTVLKRYFENHKIENIDKKVVLAEQYYALMGLGEMKVRFVGYGSGEVELYHSHLDEGWINKWGKHDKPVNHVTRGYIAAMFCLFNDQPKGSYYVTEVASIVKGADISRFNAVLK